MEYNKLGAMYTEVFRKFWDQNLFSDYGGSELKYKDVYAGEVTGESDYSEIHYT